MFNENQKPNLPMSDYINKYIIYVQYFCTKFIIVGVTN